MACIYGRFGHRDHLLPLARICNIIKLVLALDIKLPAAVLKANFMQGPRFSGKTSSTRIQAANLHLANKETLSVTGIVAWLNAGLTDPLNRLSHEPSVNLCEYAFAQ
ncbi:MAG: hypothetical protein GY874_03190 [Desulfobacteraceae bacterium]|nr:hypothetical protein [Desulfobacteraceae bacterium]